jgi:translation initiation factor 1
MSKKNKNSHKNRQGVVYSTNPDFQYSESISGLQHTLPENMQHLLVRRESKGRGGKVVTVVEGFVGTGEDLKSLGKLLRNKCGVGGSQKDGDIIIQGDVRDKVHSVLLENHYNAKKSG